MDLALHADEGAVSRQDIAERQEISAGYLAQLFRPLHEAGLVEGAKGSGSGYQLARATALITAVALGNATDRRTGRHLEGAVDY